jgi:putative SOS response-associated peptidase YedK
VTISSSFHRGRGRAVSTASASDFVLRWTANVQAAAYNRGLRHNPFYFGRRGDAHHFGELKPHARLTAERSQMKFESQMCSRFTIAKDEVKIRIRELEIVFGIVPRYNVAPSQKVTVIVEENSIVKPQEMAWGWKPVWSKQLLINAQSETVNEKSTFKKYLHQRCLIPADGFYEWTPDKTPIRFTKPRDELFCFAGLWLETVRQELDEPIYERSFLILTTTPNKTVARVHNRMPFIVPEAHYNWWLEDGELFESVLGNPDKEELQYCPVNRALNNPRNEGAELIRPSVLENELGFQ